MRNDKITLLAVPALSMIPTEVKVKVLGVLACECGSAEPGRFCDEREVLANMRLLEVDAQGGVREPVLGGRHDEGWKQIHVSPSCADRLLEMSARRSVVESELGFTD